MRSPSGDQATECGELRFPPPDPNDPNALTKLPSASNNWMRLLPESATAMRSPSGDQAAACGPLNVPLAAPPVPNLKSKVPSA